jgi:hypothetical protein
MYQHLIKDKASSDGYKLDISSQGRAIGGSLTRNLLCLTQLAFQGLAPISAAGSIITTYSIQNAESLPFPLPGSIPIMPQVFYGLVLMLVCWLVGVAVAFRIIDIMVRVAMMVMLCPLFIALAVFPATRSKAATAVKFFASAVLGFVEISLAVGVTVPMFYYAIAGDKKDELIKAMVADSSTEYVPNLFAQFSANGLKFLLVIAGVAWMAFQLLEQVAVFFEKVFPLGGEGGLTVRNMASKGKMTEGMNSVRQFVGDHYDVVKKANVGKNLANSRIGQGVKKFANSVKSAGRKLYDGAKGSAAGRFTKKAGEATGKAIDKAGKAIGSGMQKGGKSLIRSGAQVSKAGYGLGAIVGVPMMAAGAAAYAAGTTAKVMGKVGRFAARNAGRAARAAGRFAKEQAKKGVYDFFHPEDKDS